MSRETSNSISLGWWCHRTHHGWLGIGETGGEIREVDNGEGREEEEVAKYEKAAGDLKNSSGSYQLLVPWYFSLFLPYECHIQHHIHLYQNIMPLA